MSISRGRGESESSGSTELPVVSIHRKSDASEEPGVRKSVSYSNFEKDKPLPNEPLSLSKGTPNPLHDDDDTIVFSGVNAPVLRALSPGPPISADLSIILEADTSGLSNRTPSSRPSPSSSPVLSAIRPSPPIVVLPSTQPSENSKPVQGKSERIDQDAEADTSALDLSTTHLTNQVLDAMFAEDSNTATQWLNADKGVIIDVNEPQSSRLIPRKSVSDSLAADQSFNLGALDSDLAALLSPHRLPHATANVKHLKIVPRPPQVCYPPVIDLSQPSPASADFPPSPSGSSAGFTPSPSSPMFPPGSASSTGSLKPVARSPLPKQQSSLPRLRPPSWHSPSALSVTIADATSTASPEDESEGMNTGMSTARISSDSFSTRTQVTTPSQRHTPAPPSPLSLFTAASSSSSTKACTTVLPAAAPSIATRRNVVAPQPRVFTPSSSRLPAIARPPLREMVSAPSSPPPTEWVEMEKESSPLRPPSRPSSTSTHKRQGTGSTGTTSRPSNDSTTRGSLDQHQRPLRPSLESSPLFGSKEQNSPSSVASPPSGRPSLDQDNQTVPLRPNSRSREAVLSAARTRKRSMSVQDRFSGGGRPNPSALFNSHHQHTRSREEYPLENLRPSSSLSGRFPSGRMGLGVSTDREREKPPATEWLGPRTVKAFKAAGLMDFDREQESGRDRNNSGIGSSGLGLGPTLGKLGFGSGFMGRSASEYGSATRAHSRMAFSEAGSGIGGSAGRRGSSSGTLSSYGLMESPTFTASSGSRGRDTPTTAPTSVGSASASPFGFFGRENGEREEIWELKEKHLTETGALLGALSDSQRTTKMLREENGELREKIGRLGNIEVENERLRRVVDDLRKEVEELRLQFGKAGVGASRVGTWTARRSGLRTSISSMNLSQTDEEWGTSMSEKAVRHDTDLDRLHAPSNNTFSSEHEPDQDDELDLDHTPQHHFHHDHDPDHDGLVSSTPVPISKTHKRRFSTTSSIFPAPPANMTMLLHDSDDGSSMRISGSPAASIKGQSHHKHNTSVASISPTTENFSMVTGSPGSLFLRPEHEVHLGDMESLDLGVRSGSDGLLSNDDDGW